MGQRPWSRGAGLAGTGGSGGSPLDLGSRGCRGAHLLPLRSGCPRHWQSPMAPAPFHVEQPREHAAPPVERPRSGPRHRSGPASRGSSEGRLTLCVRRCGSRRTRGGGAESDARWRPLPRGERTDQAVVGLAVTPLARVRVERRGSASAIARSRARARRWRVELGGVGHEETRERKHGGVVVSRGTTRSRFSGRRGGPRGSRVPAVSAPGRPSIRRRHVASHD